MSEIISRAPKNLFLNEKKKSRFNEKKKGYKLFCLPREGENATHATRFTRTGIIFD